MQACKIQTHSASVTLHKASWAGMHAAAAAALAAGKDLTLGQTQVIGPSESPAEDEFPGLYSANLAATLFPANPFLSAHQILSSVRGGWVF